MTNCIQSRRTAAATAKPTKKNSRPAPARSSLTRAAKKKMEGARAQDNRVQPTSKIEAIVKLLRRAQGASIEELMKATGWQAHSVRGAISGSIKRKLGLSVFSVGGRFQRGGKFGARRHHPASAECGSGKTSLDRETQPNLEQASLVITA